MKLPEKTATVNILLGYTVLLSFARRPFSRGGAYVTGILLIQFGWHPGPDLLLLHIPLYGLLTVLLLLTFIPKPGTNLTSRYQAAAWIAVAVGVVDEYHQAFIPSRDASVTDVLLDILGVGLVMILAWRVPPHRWMKPLEKLGWPTR